MTKKPRLEERLREAANVERNQKVRTVGSHASELLYEEAADEIARLEAERDDEARRRQYWNHEHAVVSAEIARLTAERDEAVAFAQDRSMRVGNLCKDIANLTAERDALQVEVDAAHKALDDMTRSMNRQVARAVVAEGKRDALRDLLIRARRNVKHSASHSEGGKSRELLAEIDAALNPEGAER